MTLYFITGNKHKFSEAKQIFPEIEQLDIDLIEIQSMDPKEIIAAKLQEALKQCPGPLFCEDVSLSISAFQGFPGPLVKFWNKSGSNQERVQRVHTQPDHSTKVVCTIGYSDGKEMHFFEGVVNGRIVMPRAASDFGFDPIFEVSGTGKTYAKMSLTEKNKCSHRYLALLELKKFLEKSKT